MTSDIRFDEREIEKFNSIEIKKKDIQEICKGDLAKDLLTIEELRSPRSYDAFIEWYERKIELFSESEKTKKIARLCGSPYKEFREEVMSFRALADEIMKGTAATVEFPCDSGNRDVILHDLDGEGSIQFIEVVSSNLDEIERRRMEMLSYKGHASLYGHARKIKHGESYRLVLMPKAKKREDIENEIINNALKYIEYKDKKKYKHGTLLLVSIDYSLLHRDESIDIVVCGLKKKIPDTQFSYIYLVTGPHSCARIQ